MIRQVVMNCNDKKSPQNEHVHMLGVVHTHTTTPLPQMCVYYTKLMHLSLLSLEIKPITLKVQICFKNQQGQRR